MSSPCAVCGGGTTGCHVVAVVPVFKSEDHIPHVYGFLSELSRQIPGGIDVCFVVDGSPDLSIEKIREHRSSFSNRVDIVELSRNFGTISALHAGLNHVSHCVTVVFGSDLQEPESLFIDFVGRVMSGKADVCLGRRLSRDDPFTMRLFSGFYWWLNRHFLENDTPRGGFDVFGISRRAREALIGLPELNTSITSQLQWIGFHRVYVPYERRARISGESTWSMRRKFKLFADSVYGFSGAPIALLTVLGISTFFIVSLLSILTFIGWAAGWVDLPGYTTLVLLIGLSQAVSISGLGILGGYLYRTFDNSKGRPQYIVKAVEQNISVTKDDCEQTRF